MSGLKTLETAGRRLLSRVVLSRLAPDEVLSAVPDSVRLQRILLMRWDAIGDMVISLPFFRAVRKLYPDAEVGIVVSRRNLPVLKYEEGFQTILYDGSPSVYLRSLMDAVRFGPDAVVDTRMHYDSTTSFIYGVVSGAPWQLSASNRDNRLPYSVRVPIPSGRYHNADLTRVLLEGLGRKIDVTDLDREIRLSTEETEWANSFWRAHGLSLRHKAVGVNVSARDPDHRWNGSETSLLCSYLVSHGMTPVLISSPDDHDEALAIAASSPGALVAPISPTILHATALIRDFSIFVTPDTGLVHIAAAHGVPVVGLYCPNEEHLPRWHPWRVRSEVLMREIRVWDTPGRDVFDAVLRLAEGSSIAAGNA